MVSEEAYSRQAAGDFLDLFDSDIRPMVAEAFIKAAQDGAADPQDLLRRVRLILQKECAIAAMSPGRADMDRWQKIRAAVQEALRLHPQAGNDWADVVLWGGR